MIATTKKLPPVTYSRAKVSTSGQVTLPADIRRILGVEPGDAVVFRTDKEGRVVVRKPKSAADLAGIAGPRPDNLYELLEDAKHYVREDEAE